MQSLKVLTLLIACWLLGEQVMAQTENLDILGRPFNAGVTALPAEDVELVPWLLPDPVLACVTNRMNKMPGVKEVMSQKNTESYRYLYRRGRLPDYIRVKGRQYLLRVVVEGGDILYARNPDGSQGKELNRYADFRISLINVATSKVDFVTWIHAESKPKMKEALAAKAKNPRVNVHTYAVYESLSEGVRKKVAPFFMSPVPMLKFIDGEGKYSNGFLVPGLPYFKEVPKRLDVFIVKSKRETDYGTFYEFQKITVGLLVKKTVRRPKAMYTIGSGKKKILKELAAGGVVYTCPDLDVLR